MLNTSNEYKKIIADSVENKTAPNLTAKATITLTDSTVLDITEADIVVRGLKIKDGTSSSNSFDIGSAIINEGTLQLNNVEGKFKDYDFYNAEVIVFSGLRLSATTEWLKKGTFYVDEPTEAGSIITLVAYDNMEKFDTSFSEVTQVFPCTALSLLQTVCTHCGVFLNTSSFLNDSFIIEERPSDEAITCREIVAWIAQLSGNFARCNVDGALELKWYNTFPDIIDGGDSTPYKALSELQGNSEQDVSVWATNLITNGDFSNGTTGWSALGTGTVEVVNNYLKLTANSNNPMEHQAVSIVASHKYYMKADRYIESGSIGSSGFYMANATGLVGYATVPQVNTDVGTWVLHSYIYTALTTETEYLQFGRGGTATYVGYFDNVMLLDLTAIFGAGKEPTKAVCDVLFATWFDGKAKLTDDITTYTANSPSPTYPSPINSVGTYNSSTIKYEFDLLSKNASDVILSTINFALDNPLRSNIDGTVFDKLFRDTDGVWKTYRDFSGYTLLASDIVFIDTSLSNIDYVAVKKPLDYIGYGNTNTNIGTVLMDRGKEYTGGTNDVANIGKFKVNTSTLYIIVVFAKGTTLAQAQTALAGTKMQYQLATPTVEILSAELQTMLNSFINMPYDTQVSTVCTNEVYPELVVNDTYLETDIIDGGDSSFAETDIIDGNVTENYHHIYALGSATIGTDDIVITGVQVKAKGDTSDYGETALFGTTGYVIEISDNPLIQEGTAKTISDSVGAKIVGMRFRQCQITAIADPSREAGDIAFLTDKKQNTYPILLTNITYQIGKMDTISCDAESPSKNSSTRFSATTKAIVEARKIVKQEISTYDLTAQYMTNLISAGFGLYPIVEPQEDGSNKYYMADKPTLAESSSIWTWTSTGLMISKDGGITFGLDTYGNMLVNVLTAIGVNAEWIKVLTSFTVGDNFSVDSMGHTVLNDVEVTGGLINLSAPTGETSKIILSYGDVENRVRPYGMEFVKSSTNGVTASYTDKWASIGDDSGSVLVNIDKDGIWTASGTTSHFLGSLQVDGTKSRLVSTRNYDKVLLSAYETPRPMFADSGHGIVGEDGLCYIDIDPIFAETIDLTHDYRHFLTKYGQGDLWINKGLSDKFFFVVEGTPNLEFDWKIEAIQRDYNTYNLEKFDDTKQEPDTDYATLASQYLYQFEKELIG